MLYFTYVLISAKDGTLYKGMTDNIQRRLKEHNSGKVKSTKNKTPWSILLVEEHQSRETARERELYLKSGIGRQWLANLKNNQP